MTATCPTCKRPLETMPAGVDFKIDDVVKVAFDLERISPAVSAGTVGKVDGYSTDGKMVQVIFKLPMTDYYNRTWTRRDGRESFPMFLYPNEIELTNEVINETPVFRS